MNLFALVSWNIVGCLIGLIFTAVWKTRGLTLAWGFAAGGAEGGNPRPQGLRAPDREVHLVHGSRRR